MYDVSDQYDVNLYHSCAKAVNEKNQPIRKRHYPPVLHLYVVVLIFKFCVTSATILMSEH